MEARRGLQEELQTRRLRAVVVKQETLEDLVFVIYSVSMYLSSC